MKIYLPVLALVSLVAAQAGLPSCAQDCVTRFTSGDNIGSCGRLDGKCICSQESFLSDIACCLASVCDASDQQEAVTYATRYCSTFGVTVPSAVVCSSTASGMATVSSTAMSLTSGTATTTATTSASTQSAAATSTPNIGNQFGMGSSAASIFGGLLAGLALL